MKYLLPAVVVLMISVVPITYAQNYGIGMPVKLGDASVHDGDIISATGNSYSIAKSEFDQNMVGVISLKPAVAFITTTIKTQSMVTSGTSPVRVTSINGSIKSGDLLTSSIIPGAAEKADKTGYVIGTALGSYSNSDTHATGVVMASINPHLAIMEANPLANLFANLKLAAASPFLTPLTSLRYILAVLVTAISFVCGFMYFGRIAKTGLEALGRNPLASQSIEVSVFVNVGLSVGIMLFGVVLAYIILVL